MRAGILGSGSMGGKLGTLFGLASLDAALRPENVSASRYRAKQLAQIDR